MQEMQETDRSNGSEWLIHGIINNKTSVFYLMIPSIQW